MLNLRSLSTSVLTGVFCCALALHSQEAPAPSIRITSQVSDQQVTRLKGTVHPLATALNDRGVAPDSMPLDRLRIYLKRSESQEAALKQLISEQHTPGTANYHKWLTPEQFGKSFGPSDQDIATVQSWLAGKGFSGFKVSPGKLTLEMTGSVAQLRTAFHTQIHQYAVNGETHFANATDPEIPSALAPVVGGFVTLNNFRPRAASRNLGTANYDKLTHASKPSWTYGTSSSESFVLSPADYAVQYDLARLYTAGIDGTGQSIAIVNEANINVALVNQFRTLFSLPYNPPQVIVDGNDPGIDGSNNPGGPNGASVEAYLDVEWAGAVAPKATVYLVIAADTAISQGLEMAAERAVFSNIAPVISLSFGACESSLGAENAFINQLWEQAAAQGITVMVSSGDSGSAGCDSASSSYAVYGQQVNGFASTPWNVAVGGTDFYYSNYNGTSAALNSQLATYWNTTTSQSPAKSILQVIPEQPWNDSQFGLNAYDLYSNNGYTIISGTGGGASNCALGTYDSSGNTTACTGGYAKPAWQSVNIAGTQYVPSDSVRDIPDVSLFAADGLNYTYYPLCAVDGDCQPASGSNLVQISGVGGTSASAPAFAGIMALVNQQTGARQGQANTILYPMKAQFPSAFHEVTNGTNSVPCRYSPNKTTNCIAVTNPIVYGVTQGQIGVNTTPSYNAGAGYNLATGLGTIDAYNLVMNWSSVKLAATTTTLALNPIKTTYNHGDAITFSGTVAQSSGSATPSGAVALITDSTEQAQQGQNVLALTSGAYSKTISTLPGGTYNVWTQYTGDSTNATSNSAKTQITVNSEASGIDFYGFSIGAYGGDFYVSPTTGSTTLDYGTQLDLHALVGPSNQLTAIDTCVLKGTGCSSLAYTMPTGTVTFTDNGTTLNVASINAQGFAEFNAPFKVGTHSVTASFAGDKSYNTSTASPITFTVAQDTPQIWINSSALNSSTKQILVGPNQPAVLSMQVENSSQAYSTSYALTPVAAPTGTVTLSGLPSGVPTTATLSAAVDPSSSAVEGVGSILLPATTPTGNYTVKFTYSGDANYVATSATYSIQIASSGSGKTTTTAATMTGSISPTTNITVSGTVTGVGSTAPPTGGVLVYSSGYTDPSNTASNYLGEAYFNTSLNSTSSFSFTLNSASLTQGANFITLQYTGDSVYAPSATVLNALNSIPNPLSDFTLVPATTNLAVTAGSSATDVVQLGSINGFNGTVNLSCTAAAGISCTVPATAGLSAAGSTSATLTVNAQALTANQSYNVLITATDAATGKYVHTLGINAVVSGSTAGSKSFALTPATTSLSLDQSASINNSGTSAITVTPLGGFTGTVALTCAVSPAGANSPQCSVATPVTLGAAQTATLTVTTNASSTAGSYTVTVTGTSGAVSITTPVAVTVGAASFAVSNSGAVTVATKGTAATATITITPSNGFTGTVNLSCVVTAPAGANAPATCSLPSSVSITSTTAQTATLSIYTTAATAMLHPANLFWPAGGGVALALLCFAGFGRKRRGWMRSMGVLVLLLTAAVVGCGGGGSSSGGNTGGTSNPGTTAGSYTVTVTATSGTLTKTSQVTVTVN